MPLRRELLAADGTLLYSVSEQWQRAWAPTDERSSSPAAAEWMLSCESSAARRDRFRTAIVTNGNDKKGFREAQVVYGDHNM